MCVFGGESPPNMRWNALFFAFGGGTFGFGGKSPFVWWLRVVLLVATHVLLVLTDSLSGLSPLKPQNLLEGQVGIAIKTAFTIKNASIF